MKKEFELAGMTCAGCVSHVKEALLHVAGITELKFIYIRKGQFLLCENQLMWPNCRPNSARQGTTQ